MKLGDTRYLVAFLVPISCVLGLYLGNWFSPGVLYTGFVLIPIIELFVPASPYSEDEVSLKRKSRFFFFDFILYIHVPVLYAIVVYFIWLLGNREWTSAELIFTVLNVGVTLGVSGINVAHELGHRNNVFARWMARLLLIPVLYSHFTLEHNYGHHLRVGTHEDPATARKNEPIYFFFIRSMVLGYLNAWKIERKIIKAGKPLWQHEIIWAHLVQLCFLFIVYRIAGIEGLIAYIGAAIIGMLALESVNYVEHYGLVRKKLASGRYEPMSGNHSWNSNHELGRIALFELVRHADHHYQTTRKYQTLRHLDESPQLPFGYPHSIMVAFLPPLWFYLMNPRVDKANQSNDDSVVRQNPSLLPGNPEIAV